MIYKKYVNNVKSEGGVLLGFYCKSIDQKYTFTNVNRYIPILK